MLKERLLVGLLVLMMLVVMAACSDEGEDEPIAAQVEFLTAGEVANLNFDGGSEVYRIIPFWTAEEESVTGYSLNAGSDVEGDAADGDEAGARIGRDKSFATHKPAWMSDFQYARKLKRLAWDHSMRELEREIMAEGLVSPEDFPRTDLRAKASAECGDLEVGRDDECLQTLELTFTDFDGSTTDLTVEIKGKGQHVAVGVDSDDTVSQSDIDQIVDRFDNVIYPRDHFFFGDSTIDGTDYVDRDGDGLRLIVLSHLVNESGAVGLFNPGDFVAGGNVSDILWVVVPDDDNPLASVFGTVAHEYYHMIMFGVKRVKFQTEETIWLNEAMAHTAEDLSGFGIDNVETTLAFLENVNETTMAFSGDDIEARGLGFMFVRYLFEQQGGVEYSETSGSELTDLGGAAFLTSLVRTSENGFEALNAAIGADWKSTFGDWLAAVTLDGLEIADDDNYKYVDLYDDPITGQKIGICTNCTRENLYGDAVNFEGFACPEWTDGHEGTLQATGIDCTEVADASAAQITTEAGESDVQFAVVRVK